MILTRKFAVIGLREGLLSWIKIPGKYHSTIRHFAGSFSRFTHVSGQGIPSPGLTEKPLASDSLSPVAPEEKKLGRRVF